MHYTNEVVEAVSQSFPSKRSSPKKSYITDDIWRTRETKLLLKKRLRELRQRTSHTGLRACFVAWSTPQIDPAQGLEHHAYTTSLMCFSFRLQVELRVTAQRLKKQLVSARKKFLLAQVALLPEDSPAGQVLKLVKQVTGPTNPKKQKGTVFPAIQQADGTRCQTSTQMVNRWVEFFGNMEGGHRCSKQLLHEHWRRNLASFQVQAFNLKLQELPSLCDLERAFARVSGSLQSLSSRTGQGFVQPAPQIGSPWSGGPDPQGRFAGTSMEGQRCQRSMRVLPFAFGLLASRQGYSSCSTPTSLTAV